MDDRRRYNCMDKYLEKINRQFISFSREEEIKNNVILQEVLDPLIEKMKEKDELFKKLYKRKFFGGSYYDGLKVGSPNEYDIDLVLKFPPTHDVKLLCKDVPGYVNLYLPNKSGYEKWCSFSDEEWESYLDTKKVLSWMEGVVQRALNDFDKIGYSCWYIFGSSDNLHVKVRKSGPAFTLVIEGYICESEEQVHMDIDLVPCFVFNKEKLPDVGFKRIETSYCNELNEFFVVPKHAKGVTNYGLKYWRLCFHAQEGSIIHNKGHLKPALKLLKKMRDTMNDKQISSYFLKTVVLLETEKNVDSFWTQNSLSYIFMHILRRYQQHLSYKSIRYFWNENYNLLDTVQGDLSNMSNKLSRIIMKIDSNIADNPAIIAEYLLTKEERDELFPELSEPTMPWEIKPVVVEANQESYCILL